MSSPERGSFDTPQVYHDYLHVPTSVPKVAHPDKRTPFRLIDLASMPPALEFPEIDEFVRQVAEARAQIPDIPGMRVVEDREWNADKWTMTFRWRYEAIPEKEWD